MPELISPTVLMVAAGGMFVLGYLIINQMILRLCMLVGSSIYILYYLTVADTPLWDAIYASAIMMVANVAGMIGLLARNARWAVPRAHADIYPHFAGLPPGDFRALMRLARRHRLPPGQELTREDMSLDRLYFVIDGQPAVTKAGSSFTIADKTFVGEIAYLRDGRASATTILPDGGEVLEWHIPALRRAAQRKPRIQLALDAAISQDLARKVALGGAPVQRLSPAAE